MSATSSSPYGAAGDTDRRHPSTAHPCPLLLRFANLTVHGRNFVAEVQVEGRALAERWHTSWFIGTVEPAGFGELGDELYEAFGRLRGTLSAHLFHIAQESDDYAEFEHRVRERLGRIDSARQRHWVDAVATVGSGGANQPPSRWGEHIVEIERIDGPDRPHAPEENHVDALIVLDRRGPLP